MTEELVRLESACNENTPVCLEAACFCQILEPVNRRLPAAIQAESSRKHNDTCVAFFEIACNGKTYPDARKARGFFVEVKQGFPSDDGHMLH